MARGFTSAEGRVVQAFCYALDPSAGEERLIARFFGARRFAHNWAVSEIEADIGPAGRWRR